MSHSQHLPPMEEAVPGMPPDVMAAAKQPPVVTDDYVYFFGYEGSHPVVTFCQWYPCPFDDNSTNPPTTFPTTEHFMMFHKALLMGDTDIASQILCARTPAKAKSLGRKVRNFSQTTWDRECERVVEHGNLLKFSQNLECRKALLDTGNRRIVEASPNDKVWGVGFSIEHADRNKAEWGENKLGKALERVRAKLRGDAI